MYADNIVYHQKVYHDQLYNVSNELTILNIELLYLNILHTLSIHIQVANQAVVQAFTFKLHGVGIWYTDHQLTLQYHLLSHISFQDILIIIASCMYVVHQLYTSTSIHTLRLVVDVNVSLEDIIAKLWFEFCVHTEPVVHIQA